jgi:hypothetical protein
MAKYRRLDAGLCVAAAIRTACATACHRSSFYTMLRWSGTFLTGSLSRKRRASEMLRSLMTFLLLTPLLGCEKIPAQPPPAPTKTVLEVISLRGACKEDHVSEWSNYTAVIQPFRYNKKGSVMLAGVATATRDTMKSGMDEAQHPTVYHPPQIINFLPLEHVDPGQAHWTMHGVSDRGDPDKDLHEGFDSTCEMDVTNRGKKPT